MIRPSSDREVYYADMKRGDSISFFDQGVRDDLTGISSKGVGKSRKADVRYNLLEGGERYAGKKMSYQSGLICYTSEGDIRIVNLGHKRCGQRVFLRVEMPMGVHFDLHRTRNQNGNYKVGKRSNGRNGRVADDFARGVELPDFIE
jgi:hypothetical protein